VKRFWKEVSIETEGDGWGIRVDGQPVKTPARAPLVAPNRKLAETVAEEWRAVDSDVDPRAMPFTGLANAAIDRVAAEQQAFAGGLARYAEADLACYRSEWPPELVARQQGAWDPLLAWARRRYDVDFSTTTGLLHVPQPQATVERLAHEVAALDSFRLAGLSPLVTIGGSLLAGLSVLEKAVAVEDAWQTVSVDERWQLEQWGADPEAQSALENRKRDFFAASRFLELLED
jgi:chaperone required for assembly of F1-ATPase